LAAELLFETAKGGDVEAEKSVGATVGASCPPGDVAVHAVPAGGEDVVALTRAWCEDRGAVGGLAERDAELEGDVVMASILMAVMLSMAGEVGLVNPEAEVEYARTRVGAGAKVTEAEFWTGGAT
jgi:hypothetical protein